MSIKTIEKIAKNENKFLCDRNLPGCFRRLSMGLNDVIHIFLPYSFLIKILFFSFLAVESALGQDPYKATKPITGVTPLKFRKQIVASESFESVGVFDVNSDGKADIVSGSFWYEAPAFQKRHYIGPVKRYGEYWDDFSTISLDINGDGRLDFVTGGWWGNNVRWKENPGEENEWKEYIIDETGNVESTRGWDIDGDGTIEICPNNPGYPLKFYKLEKDAQGKGTGKFIKAIIAENQGHGLGFGDINGDGRGDFIISDGWLEGPADPLSGKWRLHSEFNLGTASVPILVEDVNGDGKKDLLVGQAHGYGLDWYEQTIEKSTKKRSWIKHPIDPFNSQFHTMEWTDLDSDGKSELITGKRFRAHNDGDMGPKDPLGIYYYKWNGESFTKQNISYGEYGEGKGTGIYLSIVDLRGTGRKDIVVAGKDGLCIFYNEGCE
ncbi:MAG TPA: VCBS repeat-containing protein [Cytophagaceae bacterium]|jgi:hypothetical protein